MQQTPDSPEAALQGYQRLISNLRIWGFILLIIGVLSIGIDVFEIVRTQSTIVVVSPELLLVVVGILALRYREALTFAIVAVASLFAGLPETLALGIERFSSILNLFVFLVLVSQFFSSSTMRQRYEAFGGQKIKAEAETFAPITSIVCGAVAALLYGGYVLFQGNDIQTLFASSTFIAAVLALAFGIASNLANLPQRIMSITGSVLGAALLIAWFMIIRTAGDAYPLV